jgi:hypothetical protein
MVNIIDYSPEWDYEMGGAKIIICYSPAISLASTIQVPLTVVFGNK